jgi:hypothetical protein
MAGVDFADIRDILIHGVAFAIFCFNTKRSTSSWVKDWRTHHDTVQRISV